jgi:hypothetical protein
MPVRLPVDLRPLVREFLRSRTSIQALVGNPARIHGQIPATPTFPLIVIVGDVTGTEIVAEHLDEGIVQIDVYGNISSDTGAPPNTDYDDQARLIARTVRAELLTAASYTHTRGVVTNVRSIRRPAPLPDGVNNPSRPRYSADYGITAHPHPM